MVGPEEALFGTELERYSLPSTYWGPDEPSFNKNERCVRLLSNQDWKFGDYFYEKTTPYICEN